MKTLTRQFFGVFMAAIVLVSGMGVGLVKHHCQLRGESVHLAIFEAEDHQHCHQNIAQNPSSNPSFQRNDCCDDVTVYQQIDVSSCHKTTTLGVDYAGNDVLAGNLFDFNFSSITYSLSEKKNFVNSFSSLLMGRYLRSWIQVWVI
jgi:hypothetical protein